LSIYIYIIITVGVLGIYNYFLSRGIRDVVLSGHKAHSIFWMVMGVMFGREINKGKWISTCELRYEDRWANECLPEIAQRSHYVALLGRFDHLAECTEDSWAKCYGSNRHSKVPLLYLPWSIVFSQNDATLVD